MTVNKSYLFNTLFKSQMVKNKYFLRTDFYFFTFDIKKKYDLLGKKKEKN